MAILGNSDRDQRSPFTRADDLGGSEVRWGPISMDSRGRALGNAFVERLWRSAGVDQEPFVL